jgi:DHA1 family tetracycline resistance protein-like MFS transporter
MKKSLFLIFAFIFVDVLGFSLILPLLPFYAQAFKASESLIGLLLAANAVTQMIGAPTMGRFSDRYGRKPLLVVSLIGTVVGFVLLGGAGALWMLFLSRLIDGLLGGNISLAQAYISDVTDEENRAKGLGLVGASFGLGFIFGPALGGTLSAGDNYALPAFVAAGLAAVNLIGVLIWLPESLPREKRQERATSSRSAFSLRQLWEALRLPCVGPLGLSASLGSLTRIVSPILAGSLMQTVGTFAPGVLGGLVMLGLSSFIWLRVLFVPDMSCPDPANA